MNHAAKVLKVVHVKGKIFSGKGEGSKFIKLPWVRKQIVEKLGFIPYPGTLNIKLTEDGAGLKKLLKKKKPTEIKPERGFCRGKCFDAYLTNNLKGAIVLPEIVDYPENVIQVIAPINLKEELQLKDGDVIEVKIMP